MLRIIDNYVDLCKCFSHSMWQEYGFDGCSFHMNFNKTTESTTIKEAFTDYTEKKKTLQCRHFSEMLLLILLYAAWSFAVTRQAKAIRSCFLIPYICFCSYQRYQQIVFGDAGRPWAAHGCGAGESHLAKSRSGGHTEYRLHFETRAKRHEWRFRASCCYWLPPPAS